MDIFERLELLQSQINSPKKIYIYYEVSTGAITTVSPNTDVDDINPYLEVFESDLTDPITNLEEFIVIENDGKMEIAKANDVQSKLSTIDDIIYQLHKISYDPTIKISQANYKFDLLIEQDNIKKEFRLRVSDPIKSQYQKSINLDQSMLFFVTADNDPNILYQTIDISMFNLLKHHYFTIPYNGYDGILCNIFSRRYFQNYLHIVIE
jgi:hypothetical protein